MLRDDVLAALARVTALVEGSAPPPAAMVAALEALGQLEEALGAPEPAPAAPPPPEVEAEAPPAGPPLLRALRSQKARLRHREPPARRQAALEAALALRALRRDLRAGLVVGPDARQRLFQAFSGLPAATVQSMLDQCGGDAATAFEVLAGLSAHDDDSDSDPEPEPDNEEDDEHEQIASDAQLARTFAAFAGAESVDETVACFAAVAAYCGCAEAEDPYAALRDRCAALLPFRLRRLFRVLDERRAGATVRAARPGAPVVVVGGGPVGLRAACELALCRVPATVLEQRGEFRRRNRLHIWAWVVADLTRLGAKVLHPGYCASGGYTHVGTGALQLILLKAALVLGARVEFGARAAALDAAAALVRAKDGRAWPCGGGLLDAGGAHARLTAPLFERTEFAAGQALGFVAHFRNGRTAAEGALKEFSWALQFNQRLFAELRDAHGCELQNAVYYRGDETHYFVGTPSRRSLLAAGALREDLPLPALLAPANVDQAALDAYVRRIAGFFGLPAGCAPVGAAALFDFSSRSAAVRPARLLEPGGVLVQVVGDAAIEPFWPEGLGINRGFLSALDAVWTVCDLGGAKPDELVLRERATTHRIAKGISAFSRGGLQAALLKYSTDPRTRYARSEFR